MPIRRLANPARRLPDEVVVDSSVLIAAFVYPLMGRSLTPVEQGQRLVVMNFVRAVAGGSVTAFVPQVALTETVYKLLASLIKQDFERLKRLPIDQRPAGLPKAARDLHKLQPWRISSHVPQLRQTVALMQQIGFTVMPSPALPWHGSDQWGDRLLAIMEADKQMANDAAIVMDARRLNVTNIITLDADAREISNAFSVYIWE